MTQETTTNRESDNGNAPARTRKIGPNDKCFCGSGKKYKFCHGAAAGKRKIAQEANSPS
jgi:preprotein translocase subunit SecA